MPYRPRMPFEDRFWSKVDRRSENECWPWLGKAKTSFGYGRLTMGRSVNLKAHRVSWELSFGPIPDGMNVCHKCDNPSCCNPHHFFLGTKKDNTHDMMRKGRMSKPPVRHGDAHHLVTIPDAELPKIRNSSVPRRKLAELYGVSFQTIYRIQKGRSRAHENQPCGN